MLPLFKTRSTNTSSPYNNGMNSLLNDEARNLDRNYQSTRYTSGAHLLPSSEENRANNKRLMFWTLCLIISTGVLTSGIGLTITAIMNEDKTNLIPGIPLLLLGLLLFYPGGKYVDDLYDTLRNSCNSAPAEPTNLAGQSPS